MAQEGHFLTSYASCRSQQKCLERQATKLLPFSTTLGGVMHPLQLISHVHFVFYRSVSVWRCTWQCEVDCWYYILSLAGWDDLFDFLYISTFLLLRGIIYWINYCIVISESGKPTTFIIIRSLWIAPEFPRYLMNLLQKSLIMFQVKQNRMNY